MKNTINNFSEIGRLKKVLMHRPGEEFLNLTPNTLERLLFDDIPYLKTAQMEHDAFAKLLKDNGVKVAYIVDEAAKVMEDPRVRQEFIEEFLKLSRINSKGMKAALMVYFMGMEPAAMIKKVIA